MDNVSAYWQVKSMLGKGRQQVKSLKMDKSIDQWS